MSSVPTVIPVILAGGQGTRLWPASTVHIPKQFIKIGQHTLMYKAVERASAIATKEIVVVTGSRYLSLFSHILTPEMTENNHEISNITLIGEPEARNTTAAIALAVRHVQDNYENAVLLVMTADHLITPIEYFSRDVQKAIDLACTPSDVAQGHIVTFGIRPTHAETGYGYIEEGSRINESGAKVSSFREKPDKETAEKYLATGNFLWNSGMFCFQSQVVSDALEKHSPSIYNSIVHAHEASSMQWHTSQQDGYKVKTPHNIDFSKVEKISIDYSIMEHAHIVAVVRASFEWNDIGSWDEAAHLLATPQEEKGNLFQLPQVNAENVTICSDIPVGVSGVSNIIVVVKNNRALILRKGQGQTVSEFAKQEKNSTHDTF